MRFNLQIVYTLPQKYLPKELYTSVLKITSRGNEEWRGLELFIRGNISPDLFVQQPNTLTLRDKQETV